MPSSFSLAVRDRQIRSGDNPVEQSYDSVGGDDGDDNSDDDDLAYTEDNNSKEEREDQLDQDDPGNFRDSIYDSFKTRDCMRYRVVYYTTFCIDDGPTDTVRACQSLNDFYNTI